ncbi:MAG: DUF4286 family protein [Bacteroidetes bacterium]|nr:DUF4286 family protein [Bacteroidota bacterium]MCC6838050.1 DUF4286 family protein [Bacteroidia bacterium]
MIIYNVTVNIENDVREEWLQWMKAKHIPDVMATGYFLENKICKVLVDEEQGTTYSIQYTCASMDDLKEYQAKHAPRLQKEVADKYANKFVAFRTLLEIV